MTDHIHEANSWIEQLGRHALATPTYVFNVDEMAQQLCAVREALGTPLVLSLSACPYPDVQVRLPAEARLGVRCSSMAEMNVVAAWNTDFAYLSLPSMDAPTMRAMLAGKFRLIADSADQLEMLASVRGKRPIAPVTLSINMGAIDRICGHRTLDDDHIGMELVELKRSLALARSHEIPIGGLQVFAGRCSFTSRSRPIVKSMCLLVPYVEAVLGYALSTVNLGGGLEEDWQERGHEFPAYRRELAGFGPHLQLMHDVGRSVTASAGCFVTTVVATKAFHGRRVAICDGGMAQAHAPALSAGTEHIASTPLIRSKNGQLRQASAASGSSGTVIAGASSSRYDGLGCIGDELVKGDVLYFPNAGAYSLSSAPAAYTGLARAAVHVWQEGVTL
jgi:diaminopimelate decarboxylase